jgi:hypothetical protein
VALSGACTLILSTCSNINRRRVDSTINIGDNSTAVFHVAFILDPLSEHAQKWSSIIEVSNNDRVRG